MITRRPGNRIIRTVGCVIAASSLFLTPRPAATQTAISAELSAGMIRAGSVLPAVSRIVNAAGDRFRNTQKGRWLGLAELREAPGKTVLATVQMSMEWKGILSVISPDRQFTIAPTVPLPKLVSGIYQTLAEILLEDSVDGFLYLQTSGAAMRQVGFGYRDAESPSGAVDVFSIMTHSRTKIGAPAITKQYWFDSGTHLLQKVIYSGSSRTEVRFEGWVMLSNNAFPTIITRFENGRPTLHVTLAPQAILAKIN